VDELLIQICLQIKVEAYAKGAIIIKRGFPPRPVELNPDSTLQEAGFAAREKLIVNVDEEMAEKLRAEYFANLDPIAAESEVLKEEKRSMAASNVGCDPA